MTSPVSKHRLHSSAFERPGENKLTPKRVIYLSVEGDETERNYFEHLNSCMENTLLKIEVLRHKRGDGYSDPENVIELLEEYVLIREGELIPDKCIEELAQKYTKQELKLYLSAPNELSNERKNDIRNDLLLSGIHFDYRKYLKSIEPHEEDIFAVVIDRDCGTHSRELMEACWEKCKQNGFSCYITNPCFEFWLLLHLCDVKDKYTEEELYKFLINAKTSGQHTVTSAEVSNLAHHGKTINLGKFKACYYPKIKDAIAHAKSFTCEYPDVLDELGTNLPQLFISSGILD